MEKSCQITDVDQLQLKLFSKYKFQLFAFICLGITYARGAWNVFGVLFLAADSGHSCDPHVEGIIQFSSQEVASPYSSSQNFTLGNTSSSGEYVGVQKGVIFKECDILVFYENGTNASRPCNYGWVYDSEFKSTIVSEWDLVCVRAYLAELSTTLYMAGSMIGALLITPMADKFGRRLVLLTCLVSQAVLGACVSWSPSYIVFTALRFIVGFFNMGIALSTYVMMTEIFPAQHRTIPCCGFQIFWAFGIMLTALFGFLVRDWRHLQLIFSLPNLLCAALIWFLPESLPWLISQNKLKKAQAVVESIAKFNGIDIPTNLPKPESQSPNEQNYEPQNKCNNTQEWAEQPLLSGTLSHHEAVLLLAEFTTPSELRTIPAGDGVYSKHVQHNGLHCSDLGDPTSYTPRSGNTPVNTEVQITIQKDSGLTNNTVDENDALPVSSVFVLCYSSRMCLYSVIIFYLYFANSLSYFGISLSTPVLHGNQFLNLFLLGMVEVPAYILCLLVCDRFGRKIPLCIFLLMCGVMNIIAVLITEDATSGLSHLRIACVMVGKFAITGGYTTVYLYSAEIFPTSVRNHAIGISSCFENFGSIAAPFIVFSAKSVPELPMILFGVVSIIGGALVIIMPETQSRPLPQNVEDVESWDFPRH
ncbi:unnamed protein product [Candidula unifasciata]|uniref:Major facilitator superfamily (MFS) profile domain-containing protein n=1 Tax=Candidula unifasciata TaxID=100452 RepID=A0A8S3YV89_9EUPU|nr:unnamed protein product [Candidula unifasciata]